MSLIPPETATISCVPQNRREKKFSTTGPHRMGDLEEDNVPSSNSRELPLMLPNHQALDLSTSSASNSIRTPGGSPSLMAVRRENPLAPWELSPPPQATSLNSLPGSSRRSSSPQQLSPEPSSNLHNLSPDDRHIYNNCSSPEAINNHVHTVHSFRHSPPNHQSYSLHSSSSVLMDENMKRKIESEALQIGSDRLGQPKRHYDILGTENSLLYNPVINGSVSSPQVNSLASVGAFSSLYDCSPHQSSLSTSSISPLTMTSYVLSRKRRQEAKDRQSDREQDPKRKMIKSATETNELSGSEDGDNKKNSTVPEEKKDDAYWERRRKNNEAAKRSRDARRQKEEEIAMRAAFLEQENLKLRAQITVLKNETAKLHYLLYNSRV